MRHGPVHLVIQAILMAFGGGTAFAAATEATVFQFGSVNGTDYNSLGAPEGGVAVYGSASQQNLTLAGVAVAGGQYGFGAIYTLDLSLSTPAPNLSPFATTQVSGEEPDHPTISAAPTVTNVAPQFLAAVSTGGTYHNGSLVEITLSSDGEQSAQTEYTFQGNTDGNKVRGPVAFNVEGDTSYGTAEYGGTGFGVLFQLQGTTETIVHTFGGADGAYPTGGVLVDPTGNIYCTTSGGGAYGHGAVFKLDKSGASVLYSFQGGSDGATPMGGLIEDSAGNLYGTTAYGGTGTGQGNGTVFSISPGGTKTILYDMTGHTGIHPAGNLVRSASGDLYGTTDQIGGKPDAGTVFEVSAAGTGSIVHRFETTDGYAPDPELTSVVESGVLTIYGATASGGDNNQGVIFKVTVTP